MTLSRDELVNEIHSAMAPKERHEDFESLRNALNEICAKILFWVISVVSGGIVVVTAALIGMFANQRVLISNFEGVKKEIVRINQRQDKFYDQLERTNERVFEMYYAGKFNEFQPKRKER